MPNRALAVVPNRSTNMAHGQASSLVNETLPSSAGSSATSVVSKPIKTTTKGCFGNLPSVKL